MIFVNGLLWMIVGVFFNVCIKFGFNVFFNNSVNVFFIFKFLIVIGWFVKL